MTSQSYIEDFLAREQFCFSWEEWLEKSGKSEVAAQRMLSKLVSKGDLINLRQGFYLILPPRYKNQQFLPLSLFVDQLFHFLERNYYVGLYSAASLYGASHQQVMRDYILTPLPKLHNIQKGNFDIQFLSLAYWPEKNILTKKSDAGYYQVSSPALTAVDLIHHHKKLGGMNRVYTVLVELMEEISPEDMTALLSWYPFKSSLQRLAYLLEQADGEDSILALLKLYFKDKKYFPVLLSPRSGQRAGAVYNSWKVDVNVHLDSDI